MPRKNRVHFSQAIYHVMMRGNYRQKIFIDDRDRLYFYSLLEKSTARYGCKVHLFCLMSNHIHLVIEVNTIPLWKIIQFIATSFSNYNHRRTKRVGHLFQGRYLSKLVNNEKYFLELCVYIHLNPLKAKMTSNIDSYQWSSHLNYLGKYSLSWLTTKKINAILEKKFKKFKNENNLYEIFFKEKLMNIFDPEFCILDDEGLLSIKGQDIQNVKYQPTLQLENLSLNEISDVVCKHLNINIDNIFSTNLSKNIVIARCLITYYAHYYGNYYLKEIAFYLGRTTEHLSEIMHRIILTAKAKLYIKQIDHEFKIFISNRVNKL